MPNYPPAPQPFNYGSSYQNGDRIMDLIMRQGQIQAEGAQRSGAIWGNALAGIGQTLAGGIQQHAEEKTRRNRSQAVDELFSRETPPTPQEIFRVFGPDDGLKVIKGLEAIQPNSAGQYKDRMERARDAARGILALPEDKRPGGYAIATRSLVNGGIFKAEEVPPEYNPDFVSQLASYGAEPAKAPEPIRGRPGDVFLDPRTMAQTAAIPAEAPKPPEPRVVGRDLVDPATGRVIHRAPSEPRAPERAGWQWVMRDGQQVQIRDGEARPGDTPANVRERASTGLEKTALGFFNRAQQASEDIAPLEEKIAKAGLVSQLQLQHGGPLTQTEEQERYRQAQRSFTEARLRKESGAAIPPHEYENDARTYFAQPGDSQKTMEQKRQARAVVLDGLRFGSGKAYEEYYGERAPTPRTRGEAPPPAGPAGAGTPGGPEITATGPNGQRLVLRNGQWVPQ